MRTTVACCAKGSCTMSRGDMFPASCSVSCAAEFVSNLYPRCRNSLRAYTVQRAGASATYVGYHFFQKCLANDFGAIKSTLASANRGQCGGTGGSAVPAGTHQPAVDPVVPTGHRLLGGSGAITNNAKGKRFMLLAISKKCGSASAQAARLPFHGACAVVDISNSTASLQAARLRARIAAHKAPCVEVLLGRRTFHLREPFVLQGKYDANTRWIGEGAEITGAWDIDPQGWHKQSAGSKVFELRTSLLKGGTANLTAGSVVSSAHTQLLVRVRGVWRPMTLARWPNIPFALAPDPPVNWCARALLRSFTWHSTHADTCQLEANRPRIEQAYLRL